MKNNDRKFSKKPEMASRQPQSILFESVEARVLFSAVPAEAPAGTDDRGDLTAETIQQEAPHLETAETSVPESGLENAISAAVAESATAGNTEVEDSILADFQENADETVAEGRELVFISANGFDHDYLAANLDPSYEVYLIPDGANGLDSIAQALNGSEGVSAIHLITHGEQGRLFLGSAVLDAESIIGEYRTQLAAIGHALTENADILVYGCDFASGVEGAYAAELLAAITGTEVAASTDGTGHASLDGDWDLEASTGEIEARTLAFDSWQGLLAPPSIAAPSAEIITLEDTAIVFSGGQAITIGSDAFTSLTLTLSVGQGSLTLSGAVGITFLNGTVNGGSTLEISGLITDLNAALDGMTFTPAQDVHGSETLSLLAYDGDEINSATVDLTIVSQNDAPVIDVTPVNAGATGTPSETVSHTFTLADFEAVDPDNSNNQLTFRIESLPVVGELRLSGFPVAIGSVFTQASLASGALVYIHNGGETHADTFSVTVNDGAGGASLVTAIPITITPVNDAMSVSTTVTVYEGGNTGDGPVGPGKPIPGLSLSISDAESDAKTVTITSLPGGGVLSYNGTPITQAAVNLGFTFASANFSLLSFQHDGVDDTPTGPSNRSFGIRVTDQGGGTGVPAIVNRTVTITVVSVNDEPDLVTLSTAVPTLESGESHVLGLSDIEATDPDGDDSQLTYTMVTAPSLGELYIGGQLAGTGATFTQAQLAAGVVVFTNPGVDGLDTIAFVVKDRQISILTDELGTLRVGDEYTAPRHLSLAFDLNAGPGGGGGGILIKLTEGTSLPIPGPGAGDTIELTSLPAQGEVRVNGVALGVNSPVTLNPGDTVTYDHDGSHVDTDGFTWEINGTPSPVSVKLYLYNDSPLLLTTTLTGVYEGNTQPITTAHLIATDEETTNPAQLVYTVIGSPAAGSLLFNGSPLGAFGTFTHQDVIDGRLSYSHNGNEDFLDQIELELADGAATSTNTLSIEITPVNDQPRITASFMQLMEGEEKSFTAGALSVSDVDGVGADIPLAPDSPLQIRVDTLPTHGSLWYNHPTLGVIAVTAGFTFDANQVTRLSYEHDSSENFSDSFNFTAIDNNTYNNPGHDAPGTRAGVMNLGITPVNDAPAVTTNAGLIDDVNGDRRVFEGGYRVLTTDVLLSADPDSTNEQVQYRITSATVNGSLLLNGNPMAAGTAFTQNDLLAGRVRYLHNGSETTTDQFTFRIDDASSNVPAQVFLIGIKPVNDAPRIAAPGSAVVNTADYAFTGSRTISISDSDAGGADVTATLTVTDPGGLLRVTTTTGLTSITGNDTSNVLSLTGSVAEINAALATLRYRATDLDGPATLTIHVNDAGNTGIDPHDVPPGEITGLVDTGTATDEQATRVVNLLVSPINDVPANTIPMDQTTYEDIAFTFSTANGNAIAISDVDAFGQDVEVTLAVTNGTLSLGSVTGLTFVTGDGVSDATITFRGTPAEVNAALQGLRYLGNLDYNGLDALIITTRDLANTGDGGSLIDSDSIGITVLGVNDAPTIAGPSGTVTVNASTFAFNGANTLSIADRDADPGLLTVTLTSNDPAGLLEVTQTAGLSAISGNGTANVLTFTGTIADLNIALATLTYSPGSDLDGGSTLTLLVSDNGNTGVDPSTLALPATGTATDEQASRVFNLQVSDVNDPPVNAVPGAQTFDEDTTRTFNVANGNVISVSDVDAFGFNVTTTVSVTSGSILAGGTAGQQAALTALTGNNTSSLTLTGTVAEINAVLLGLRYTPNLHFNGTDTMTIVTNDLGNTGAGGPLSDTDQITLNVSAVNDAPVHTVPSARVTPEDTAIVFSTANGNRIAVADVDVAEGTGLLTVTLGITNGNLSLNGVGGLSFSSGTGTGDTSMVFTGNAASINAALNGLTYLPTPDYHGAAQLSITTSDNGNFGSGGVRTDADTVNITVTSVPDITSDTVSTLEDTPVTFDVIAGTNGATADNFEGSPIISRINTTDVVLGSVVSVSNGTVTVDAITGQLTFSPSEHFNGPTSFTYTVTSPTGITEQATVTVNVSPINDRPVNSVPGDQTFNEDTTRTFNVANGNVISISDVDAATGDVTTTVSVLNGRILAGGTSGQQAALTSLTGNNTSSLTLTGTVAEINAVLLGLSYTPNPNFNGTDTMTIVTNDLGNTGLGGPLSDTDQITLNVSAVNDAPVNTVPSARVTPEDTAIVFSTANGNRIAVADVDVAEGTNALTVTLDATEGTLTLFQFTGLTITAGTGTGDTSMTFTGNAADINAALNGLTFAPRPDYHGPAQLRITTSDNGNFGSGGIRTDVDTIGITVTPVADTVDDILTTDEDTPITFNVLTGAGDAEADLFSDPGRVISSHTQPSHGTITVAANGEITYTPDQDWFGVDTFQYTVTAGGSTETATVTITVDPVNDPPVAIDDTFTVPEDGSVTIDVLDDDYDVENDPITITHVDGLAIVDGGASVPVTNGSVRLVGGQLIFTPTPDYFGPASFEYTISDGEFSDTATVTGTVTPTPRALTITDVTRDEDQNLVFTVVLNKATSGPFTVDVSTLAGTATGGGVDFTDLAGHTLSFAGTKGESVTFTVVVSDDSLIENNENLTVSLGNISIADVNISATATGTILDNDARPAPAGPGTGVTTDVELVANGSGLIDLVIEDVETESAAGFNSSVDEADSADRLLIFRDGDHYVIRDTGGLWLGSPIIGATRGGTNEIRVPVAMVTGSIIIRTGIGDDTVTIGNLGATLTGGLVVNTEDPSGQFNDFDTITYNSSTTLADGFDAELRADTITAQANSSLTATGTGSVDWIAGRNIVMQNGADVITEDGDITFEANQPGVRTGNFAGIALSGATVQSTTGDISLDGRGGTQDHYNDGVRIGIDRTSRTGSTISSGGAVTIDGTGGTAGSQSNGVNVGNSSITGASVALSGTGGTVGGMARGIYLYDADLASTSGDLTVHGTGQGNGLTSSNFGVATHANTTLTAAGNGAIDIRGTGGAGTGGLNTGVLLSEGTSATVANGDLTVAGTGGTGGSATSSQNRGTVLEKATLRSTGAGDISIDGTGNGLGHKHLGVAVGASTIQATGTGSIDIAGTGSTTGSTMNHGLTVSSSTIQTAGGSIGLTGTGGGTQRKNDGIEIDGGSSIRVTAGSGNLTIAGTAGNGDSDNVGTAINAATLSTVNGNLSVTGTGNGTLDRNRGVFGTKVTATTTGSGSLTIAGTGSTNSAGKSNEGVTLVSSSTRTTGTGNLTITGHGGRGNGGNHGINFNATTATSANGTTSLTGIGHANATGTANVGIAIQKSSRVEGATLNMAGTGGGGASKNYGFFMVGGTARATGGSLTLIGQARSNTTGTANLGVWIENKVTLSATGAFGITGTGGGGTAYNHGVFMNKGITAAGASVSGTAGAGSKSKATIGNYFA